MSSISQLKENEYPIFDFAVKFIKEFRIGTLLFQCNAGKEKGIPIMDIFRHLLCLVFSGKSDYMQRKTGTFNSNFSKNTLYRFLNSTKTNWQRFTVLLSTRIICSFMKPLTGLSRKDVFIVDDSLFDRSRSKNTELLANVFDHCTGKYKRGFRMLTLGWSDGNSFIPVDYCLLSAAEESRPICDARDFDGRSLAGKRRRQSRRKATDVMLELITSALSAGLSARYVLFDSWFSAPKTILALKKQLGLDTIAMIKKNRTKYIWRGKDATLAQIYSQNRKRRGRSKYLLSVNVFINGKNGLLPAKIVFVRNKNNRKDWMALISTDIVSSEEEIIRIYGKRWDIEVFFKSCKSYLKLAKECRSISYDALCAHVAIVFTRYMMLSVAKRRNEDERTIGELFYIFSDELEDITLDESMKLIVSVFMEAVMEYFHLAEGQLEEFADSFIGALPKFMQCAFRNCVQAF